jgi:hypothetical protein
MLSNKFDPLFAQWPRAVFSTINFHNRLHLIAIQIHEKCAWCELGNSIVPFVDIVRASGYNPVVHGLVWFRLVCANLQLGQTLQQGMDSDYSHLKSLADPGRFGRHGRPACKDSLVMVGPSMKPAAPPRRRARIS